MSAQLCVPLLMYRVSMLSIIVLAACGDNVSTFQDTTDKLTEKYEIAKAHTIGWFSPYFLSSIL